MSPFSFYQLTPAEFILIAKAYNRAEEVKMDLFGLETYNAIGLSLNGKKFKGIFKNESAKATKTTKEEREETINYFRDKYKIKWGVKL